MKKSSRKFTMSPQVTGDDIRPEYDFSSGARGTYAERYAAGTNLVLVDEDVFAAFPDSQAVNTALRSLLSTGQTPPPSRPT